VLFVEVGSGSGKECPLVQSRRHMEDYMQKRNGQSVVGRLCKRLVYA